MAKAFSTKVIYRVAYIDRVFQGSCENMSEIPDGVVHTCVTSPPYWGLRDYGHTDQIGMEPTPAKYIERMVRVFREVRRVLRPDGTVWLNLGDSYCASPRGSDNGVETSGGVMQGRDLTGWKQSGALDKRASGLKPKDLIGIPWSVAFALREDGWYLRSDIIWHKPTCMPSSVTDRPTTNHEYIFLLSKSRRYYYDQDSIREPVAEDRPQSIRAAAIARERGITEAHLAAIRAVGITDTGKAQVTQNGFGHNTEDVIRLANEAKEKLGGYYREFLFGIVGGNKRTVWSVTPAGYDGAHFATFPTDLIRPCIMAGAPPEGLVLDPFMGSGTTARVALEHGRHFVGYELNDDYFHLIRERLGLFGEGVA